jgi:hypothetical protein
VRFAYADPPYLGLCRLYDHFHGDDGRCWDDPETHRLLIERLCAEYQDGWAMSLHSPSLRTILAMCPADVRVSPWVKPFCSFKPGVNPAYAWEPVIWRGGRKRDRTEPTVQDFLICNITLRRGFTGAKPDPFALWLLDLLGARPEDDIIDLFPGSGAVSRAWAQLRGRAVEGAPPDLFGAA